MEEAAGSIPASSTNIFTKLGGTTGKNPVPRLGAGFFNDISKEISIEDTITTEGR
jgi:hypothetical protein